ncbi:MAG TPA: ribose 5-phosphate isomerase A [Gemmatimonadales bacterium]|jgi:ribose 5-phosphate isomerase A
MSDDHAALDIGRDWCRDIANRPAKEAIAKAVAARARSGEVIGAGSGSTSFLTVVALGQRVRTEKLDLSVVPTSLEIQYAAESAGLHVHISVPARIDWCFDGADEVDADQRMIKGRGGALYRERQVLLATGHRIIVADASKSVTRLGSKHPVPVEVEAPWARRAAHALRDLPHVEGVALRQAVAKDGPVITESGGVLFDVHFSAIDADAQARIMAIPGVRGTGLFVGFAFERIE